MLTFSLLGRFQFDTQRSLTSENEPIRHPLVNIRQSVGIVTPNNNQYKKDPAFARQLHGICLTTAFLLLYPVGTVIVRSRQGNFVFLHQTCQLLGASLTVIGALLGIWYLWKSGPVSLKKIVLNK